MLRPFLWALGYAVLLLGIHLLVTRGTGAIPEPTKLAFGSDAGSVLTRPWAQFTSPWLHNSWGHISYNSAILLATMPFAVQAYGPRVILLAVLASAIVGFAVNLFLILPLHSVWPYAAAPLHGRLVGSSVVIFAGAGMAWNSWNAPWLGKAAVLAGFVIYESALAFTGVTQQMVGYYHVGGALAGIGIAQAMQLNRT